ncbi:MAG: hypothetical protein PHT27_06170 [Candidatus Izemoplasmatales bacterium]|nr:hypothetical protein [Candidatus Izemoplasmatales bacterium]
MSQINKIKRLCDQMPVLFPGIKRAWYSQGFIGVEISRSKNAEYIKLDGVPTGEIMPTIANRMAIILGKEDLYGKIK